MTDTMWWRTLTTIVAQLEHAGIDYTLLDSSALAVQQIAYPPTYDTLHISVQWDLFERARMLLQPQKLSIKQDSKDTDTSTLQSEIDTRSEEFISVTTDSHDSLSIHLVSNELYANAPHEQYKPTSARYTYCSLKHENMHVQLYGYYNTVVVTDPERVAVIHDNHTFYSKSLDSLVSLYPAGHPIVKAIKAYWQELQKQNSQTNQAAWNQDAYDAWLQRLGTPEEHAAHLKKDPRTRLSTLARYLDNLAGQRVINLLGSHASKALAMALLGAEVTVVDISQENARYAREVAAALAVPLTYIVSDVLTLPDTIPQQAYDLVFMELGILHYFVDLEPLATTVHNLLRPGGKLIVQDFHPISTKLISSKGKKHKVSGNYFDPSLITTQVAFSKHLPDAKQDQTRPVYLRRWTLGEIVTAFARSGLHISQLVEEPNSKIDDIGLPKLFTLVAHRHP